MATTSLQRQCGSWRFTGTFLVSPSPSSFLSTPMLLDAVKSGDAKELAELMTQNPGFHVNMALDEWRDNLMHYACNGRYPP